MPIYLYYISGSGPCRAVRLTAAALGVDLNLKEVNVLIDEHKKPEFLRMNPQHTLPTINDNGFYLWDSRVIMTYLVNQYGKNDSLYPKDPKKRAIVDQRLSFDLAVLYHSFVDYYLYAIVQDQDKMYTALSFLEKFLEGETYAAGKTLTLADIALAVTISCFKIIEFDLSKYSNILKWHARIEAEAPKYKEIDIEGEERLKTYVDNLRKKK